jgi:hypothetical protein
MSALAAAPEWRPARPALFALGKPAHCGGVTVVPLFSLTRARARYLTLDDASPLGLRIAEVGWVPVQPELRLRNPLAADVLLYGGEELLGGRQNRILDSATLAPAHEETRIRVWCAEQGRYWGRSRRFSPGSRIAFPTLRRLQGCAERGRRANAVQDAIWEAVARKSACLGNRSRTKSLAGIFEACERDLRALRAHFPLRRGQAGAVVAFGRTVACLDYVSRPEAFARLYPKLLDGYLLDALTRPNGALRRTAPVPEFVCRVSDAVLSGPSIGFGNKVFARNGCKGSALMRSGEIVQLSAFA